MRHTDKNIRKSYPFAEGLGDCDGAMSSSGATDADVEVGFSLESVTRNEEMEEFGVPLQKLLGLGCLENEVGDVALESDFGSEVLDKIGVLEKANINEEIAIAGSAVFETEREEINANIRFCVSGYSRDKSPNFTAKLMYRELRRVDNVIGGSAERIHQEPFSLEGIGEGLIEGWIKAGVWATGLAVSLEKNCWVSFKKKEDAVEMG